MSQPLQFPVPIPFVEELGLELWRFGDGQAELRLDPAEAHLNSWSVAHGGVLMTMLDVVMAHAARSVMATDPAQRAGMATIEMKTTFMRPAEGALRATGQVLHRTATLAFCEAAVHNTRGEICAHGTGTFKFLRGLPAADGQIKTQRGGAAAEENP